MPGAFLHKRNPLEILKDSRGLKNPIKQRRTARSWDNPILRRKREKSLNDWASSFAGKRHYRKLARFNAVHAHENFYSSKVVIRDSDSAKHKRWLKKFVGHTVEDYFEDLYDHLPANLAAEEIKKTYIPERYWADFDAYRKYYGIGSGPSISVGKKSEAREFHFRSVPFDVAEYIVYALDEDGNELDDVAVSADKPTVDAALQKQLQKYVGVPVHVVAVCYDDRGHLKDSEVVWSTDPSEMPRTESVGQAQASEVKAAVQKAYQEVGPKNFTIDIPDRDDCVDVWPLAEGEPVGVSWRVNFNTQAIGQYFTTATGNSSLEREEPFTSTEGIKAYFVDEFEALDDTIEGGKSEAWEPQPGKYLCTKGFTHGNLGTMFRKGRTYELTAAEGGTYVVGGIRVSPEFFSSHFEAHPCREARTARVSPYLTELAHKILVRDYGWTASSVEEVGEWLSAHKSTFEHGYGQALRTSDDDNACVKAGLEAVFDAEDAAVARAEYSEAVDKSQITKDEFDAYVRVQMGGQYNMIMDAVAAMEDAGLDEDTYFAIIKNYGYLKQKYGRSESLRQVLREARLKKLGVLR